MSSDCRISCVGTERKSDNCQHQTSFSAGWCALQHRVSRAQGMHPRTIEYRPDLLAPCVWTHQWHSNSRQRLLTLAIRLQTKRGRAQKSWGVSVCTVVASLVQRFAVLIPNSDVCHIQAHVASVRCSRGRCAVSDLSYHSRCSAKQRACKLFETESLDHVHETSLSNADMTIRIFNRYFRTIFSHSRDGAPRLFLQRRVKQRLGSMKLVQRCRFFSPRDLTSHLEHHLPQPQRDYEQIHDTDNDYIISVGIDHHHESVLSPEAKGENSNPLHVRSASIARFGQDLNSDCIPTIQLLQWRCLREPIAGDQLQLKTHRCCFEVFHST